MAQPLATVIQPPIPADRVLFTLSAPEATALRLMVQTCPVRMPPPLRDGLLAALDRAIEDLAGR